MGRDVRPREVSPLRRRQHQPMEVATTAEGSVNSSSQVTTRTAQSHSSTTSLPTLDFTALHLHGREIELELLKQAATRVKDGAMEMAFAHGLSGSGKTKLVETTMNPLQNTGYLFVQGKFDQLKETAQPYSAIVEAFNQLCVRITDFSEHGVKIATRIERTLGHSAPELVDLVPSLPQLLTLTSTKQEQVEHFGLPVTSEINKASFNRIKHLLREVLRAACCKEHPIVFFIDDIQWADEASMDILIHLATDTRINNLLLIVAYRDDETDLDGVHEAAVKELQTHHRQRNSLVDVPLKDIDLAGVNDLIAELVSQSVEDTHELAKLVHKKTHGNCFFLVQFLGLLQEEDHLWYSNEDEKWVWDLESIEKQTQVADNVADIIINRIDKLGPTAKAVLKAAGCLGHAINAKMVARILFTDDVAQSLEDATRTAKAEIYHLAKVGLLESGQRGMYKFAHDRIQQAAYSLVPGDEQDRQRYHVKIGFALYEMYEASLEQKVFFAAVDQLNFGIGVIVDEAERVEMAEFNLKAGTEAKKKSAFFPAVKYAKHGLDLLQGMRKWTEHFELTSALHFLSAEANWACGKSEESGRSARVLVNYCSDPIMRARAYVILVHLLGEGGLTEEAIEVGFEGLRLLGVRLPRKPGFRKVVMELLKSKKLLKQHLRTDSILTTPRSTNETTHVCMSLMEALCFSLYTIENCENTGVILNSHMVQVSFQDGLCTESPFALAVMAAILATMGDFDSAFRVGQQAEQMASREFAKRVQPITLLTIHCTLNHWGRPLKESIKPLSEAYVMGMGMGLVQPSLACVQVVLLMQYVVGTNLKAMSLDLQRVLPVMDEFKQILLWKQLTGLDELVKQLSGVGHEQDESTEFPLFDVFPDCDGNIIGNRITLSFQRELAFILGERSFWEAATETLGTECPQQFLRHFMFVRETLFSALCYFDAAKHHNSKKFTKTARKCASRVKKWYRAGSVNCQHWFLLLQAEEETIRKRCVVETVRLKFQDAIAAVPEGYFHDKALFHERAAMFFEKQGHGVLVKHHLEHAFELYVLWGARTKVRQMEKAHPTLSSFLISGDGDCMSGCKSLPIKLRSSGVSPRLRVVDTSNINDLPW